MYTVNVRIIGIAPLMQHRYPIPPDVLNPKGATRVTGSRDFSQEWKEYFYATSEGEIYQPATHIESAMISAAKQFKITGKRGKTYGDIFKANVFVSPDQILHNVCVPETLDADADKVLYLDIRPVVVQHARIVRLRPTFKAGWTLDFEIQVIDDQIAQDLLMDVLALSGKTSGLGDNRPRFGRYQVTHFEVSK